jgi:hypothetical protein
MSEPIIDPQSYLETLRDSSEQFVKALDEAAALVPEYDRETFEKFQDAKRLVKQAAARLPNLPRWEEVFTNHLRKLPHPKVGASEATKGLC